jgi:hypothetical protein
MVLIAYIEQGAEAENQKSEESPKISGAQDRPCGLIPIIGIPACGMYHKTTIFDLILPRLLAGERISREELAVLGHGGLCLDCPECRYPVCPFGKSS